MNPPVHSISIPPPQASCKICEPERACPWHQVELEVVELGEAGIKAEGGAAWTASDEIAYRRNVADIYYGLTHEEALR